mmetsp:Transcript_110473/g.307760  ORF Transcript_110473/g.307760 Transcript_110473/m.307760 type:complete len:292 (-) Transcript_110473:768-1643(-)
MPGLHPPAPPLVHPLPALRLRHTVQPVPVVALDEDHLRHQPQPPLPDQESASGRLYLYDPLGHHLLPESAPHFMATPDTLDCDHSLHLPFAHCHDPSPSLVPTHQCLDLLRRLEAPPCLFKLSTCNPLSHSINSGSCKPSTDVSLETACSLITTVYRLILELPPEPPEVASPTTLDLHCGPQLLLCADGVSPHSKTHEVATDVALDRDDGSLVREELLPQLQETPAMQMSEPVLPDDGRRPVHGCEARLAHHLHSVRRLMSSHSGLNPCGCLVLLHHAQEECPHLGCLAPA